MSQKKSYPTVDTVAIAVAAYAHNERTVIRNTEHSNGKPILPNRQLISDYFNGTPSFVVNDFHRKEAEGIIQYLQQTVIMQSLKSEPDRFLGQVTELLSNNEILSKNIGIIAWAPKLADDYQKKDHVRELSARYEHRSQYVGRVGDKTEISFTLIDKRYIKSMDCWAVYGIDAYDNLIFYWARKLDKVCEVGRIHGRIKDHKEDEYRNRARITVLNYVKVL